VTYKFDLLPRWALLVLVAREALLLAVGPFYVRKRGELKITMLGRWAVWPTMSAIAFAIAGVDPLDDVLLYVGLTMTLGATAQYVRQASTSA
jgi:cardiolipin synthase